MIKMNSKVHPIANRQSAEKRVIYLEDSLRVNMLRRFLNFVQEPP